MKQNTLVSLCLIPFQLRHPTCLLQSNMNPNTSRTMWGFGGRDSFWYVPETRKRLMLIINIQRNRISLTCCQPDREKRPWVVFFELSSRASRTLADASVARTASYPVVCWLVQDLVSTATPVRTATSRMKPGAWPRINC